MSTVARAQLAQQLVDDELAFPQPELDTLASAISDPGADDEGGGEDDDVR